MNDKKNVVCVHYTSVDHYIVNNEHASLIEKRDVFYIFLHVLLLRVYRNHMPVFVTNTIKLNESAYIRNADEK